MQDGCLRYHDGCFEAWFEDESKMYVGFDGLMTDDHMFIDNSGAVDEDVNDGWRGFLENHLITGRVHVGKSEKWGLDGDFTSFL